MVFLGTAQNARSSDAVALEGLGAELDRSRLDRGQKIGAPKPSPGLVAPGLRGITSLAAAPS